MKSLVILVVLVLGIGAIFSPQAVAAAGKESSSNKELTAQIIFGTIPSLGSKYLGPFDTKGVLSYLTHQPVLALDLTRQAVEALANNPRITIELRDERR